MARPDYCYDELKVRILIPRSVEAKLPDGIEDNEYTVQLAQLREDIEEAIDIAQSERVALMTFNVDVDVD